MAQVVPFKTPREVHAGYRVVIEPVHKRIKATFNGQTVAESSSALIMHETRIPSVYYFPRSDVRMDLMERTDHHTHCPFKGNASYWTLTSDHRTAANAAWSYEDVFDEASAVKDYIAFYWQAIDAWYGDDQEIAEQPSNPVAADENDLIPWLVHSAWKAQSSSDLLQQLAEQLVRSNFPLWRLRLLIRTLNPQLFGFGYTWQHDMDEIEQHHTTHEIMQSQQYLDSPLAPIINGEGGVRRRLDGDNPQLDFPVLHDLVEEGATDYVAMPLKFSDGQINILILVSDRAGGFSTSELGHLYEILPNLARLAETYALRDTSLGLLRTYLGSNAGKRVMDGLVKRGDGEDIHAVIWFSDLRDSTVLAQTISRQDYLSALNQYFDCVAGSVIENGGEVLKFIGDAVLAIFPIDDPTKEKPGACQRALSAHQEAVRKMAAINLERGDRGEPALSFGTGLHRGDITYGNIGTAGRLDFTVIGSAVNVAARIGDKCKTLGGPILTSQAFAASVTQPLTSRGHHDLKGVNDQHEIFALISE